MAGYVFASMGPRTCAKAKPLQTQVYTFPSIGAGQSISGGTGDFRYWRRADSPYGTETGEAFETSDLRLGLRPVLVGGVNRIRSCISIPASFSTAIALRLKLTPTAKHVTNGFTMGWYGSNTDDYGGGTAIAYNTNNLLDSAVDSAFTASVQYTFSTASLASYLARVGGHFSMILATTDDVATTAGTVEDDLTGPTSLSVEVDYR